MSWFDEQIKNRKLSDQEVLEDSFVRIASAVMGQNAAHGMIGERRIAKAALDEILIYFGKKPVDIPESITDFDEQMEYVFRPHGIMYRRIKLEDEWYKDSFGVVLAFTKDGEYATTLLPGSIRGYHYYDHQTGEKIKLNKQTNEKFDDEAICFYRPLPQKSLTIRDLLSFIRSCITTADIALIAAITAVVTLVSMIGPALYKIMTGPVLESGNINALIGIAIFMICTSVSSQLFGAMRTMFMSRIQVKTDISVEAAVMMRIMSLPPRFFRQYSSGELSQRSSSVSTLCDMLLNGVFSTGVTSLMSLMYLPQIFTFAPALLVPSITIILVTVILSAVSGWMQINISRKQMQLGSKESGLSYALLNGIQKIKLSGSEKRAFAKWANLYSQTAEDSL